MPAISRGQASNCANPILDLFTRVQGLPVDVAVLEFQIFEKVSDPDVPAQVYPVSGRQSVNIAQLCPTGDKIDTGRYVAVWTPPLTELMGTHEIRWFFKLTLASPEQTFREEFEVLPEVTGSTSTGYTTVSDMRDEGVPSTGPGAVSDTRLQTLIQRASRMIDLYTGRWFEPRSMVMLLDGTGRRSVLLGPPIISVSKIRLVSEDFSSSSELDVDLRDVKIYNRHLSGLLDPDDRENPRIDWSMFDRRAEHLGSIEDSAAIFHPARWPEGTQNVEITGIFGYTDPDGSPTGRTPEAIARACVLMVLRDLESGTSPDRYETRNASRLVELRTRDQTIRWADPATSGLGTKGIGAFTGDPEIDNILASYVRPPSLGAA